MESAIRPIHIRGATSEDHNRSRFMLRAAKQVPSKLDKIVLNPENHDRLLRLDGNLFLSEAHTYLTTYYLWCSCCRKPETKLTSILSIYLTTLDFLRYLHSRDLHLFEHACFLPCAGCQCPTLFVFNSAICYIVVCYVMLPCIKNIAKGTTDPRVEFISQVQSSQFTNFDQIAISESRLSINFKISTKHQHLD